MAETIAQAYVQILPSAEGIQGSLTELLGGEADKAGSAAGGKWAKKFAKAIEDAGYFIGSVVRTLGNDAFDLGKQALESYADYEQLAGGVETLFKDSSDAVMAYAKNAYQTAGLSANEYMETVTSFSAALIQSTGRVAQTDLDELETNLNTELTATKRSLEDAYSARKQYWDDVIRAETDSDAKAALRNQRDEELKALKRANEDKLAAVKASNESLLAETEAANMRSVTTPETLQRAAELADLAITDMADNANKMGSSMESIQTAYQGFSRGQFQLLDNLKLGYGGTAAEMQRLLQDATAISGIEYDVSSYADIVEAIHVIQTEMGITGTTAEEASKTISGSIATMKSAWTNLVTGIADENANLDKLIDDFLDSTLTAWDNLEPRLDQILEGMTDLVVKGSEKIVPALLDRVLDDLPMMAEGAAALIGEMAYGLITNIPQILAAIPKILKALWDGLTGKKKETREATREGIVQPVLDELSGAPAPAYDYGYEIGQSYADGIYATRESAAAAARAVKASVFNELEGGFVGRSGAFDGEAYTIISAIPTPSVNFDSIQTVEDLNSLTPEEYELFMQSLRDWSNEPVTNALQRNNIRNITPAYSNQETIKGISAAQTSQEPRQQTVVLMLDRTELARTVFRLNNEETQRVGLVLSGGAA